MVIWKTDAETELHYFATDAKNQLSWSTLMLGMTEGREEGMMTWET